jgi:hypothetical protein
VRRQSTAHTKGARQAAARKASAAWLCGLRVCVVGGVVVVGLIDPWIRLWIDRFDRSIEQAGVCAWLGYYSHTNNNEPLPSNHGPLALLPFHHQSIKPHKKKHIGGLVPARASCSQAEAAARGTCIWRACPSTRQAPTTLAPSPTACEGQPTGGAALGRGGRRWGSIANSLLLLSSTPSASKTHSRA